MQSILTKYIPERATKPSRIKAWTSGGAKSIIRSRHAYSGVEDAHLAVARELAESLGWHGIWANCAVSRLRASVFIPAGLTRRV